MQMNSIQAKVIIVPVKRTLLNLFPDFTTRTEILRRSAYVEAVNGSRFIWPTQPRQTTWERRAAASRKRKSWDQAKSSRDLGCTL